MKRNTEPTSSKVKAPQKQFEKQLERPSERPAHDVVNELVGHIHQRRALAGLVRDGRLPSALVFAGPPSVGKNLVAIEVAKYLLCSNVNSTENTESPERAESKNITQEFGACGHCRSCVLFAAGTHPDMHKLNFAADEGTSVEDLRESLERLSLRSFLGGSKVAVFNNADNLSTVGANVILKSLEEPRPDSYFILVLANASRLPSTLLSRCQRWYFDRLSQSDLRRILQLQGRSDITDTALVMADGSLESLDTIRAHPGMWENVQESLDAAYRGDHDRVVLAASEWASEKEILRERMKLLLGYAHERMCSSARDPQAAAVWAMTIQNVLDAEYLMFDRHVSPLLCLSYLLHRCNHAMAHAYLNTPNSHLALMDEVSA